MFISALSLTDFRSYEHADVEFGPGAMVLVGSNGEGKTNLVEAIVYLTHLQSHRTASDTPLIRNGADSAIIRSKMHKDDRFVLIDVELVAGKANRARINRAPVRRMRDIIGLCQSVTFSPEDLSLVKGDPDGRRRFLDAVIAQRIPRMAGVLSDYERILRQRGNLLRSAKAARRSAADLGTLEIWNDHLAAAGAQIMVQRRDLVSDLASLVTNAYDEVSDSQGPAEIWYQPSIDLPDQASVEDVEELLVSSMKENVSKEIDRGSSLFGPHRDEIVTRIGGLPARGYASHGESWSLALALRLASFDLLREELTDPILILDDVFAELDATRRQKLVSRVMRVEQTFVTAAVDHDVPPELDAVRYRVHDQVVTKNA